GSSSKARSRGRRTSSRSRRPSSAGSSTRRSCGFRSTACRPATPGTGTTSRRLRFGARRRSASENPQKARGPTAASFSGRPDEAVTGRCDGTWQRSMLIPSRGRDNEGAGKMRKYFEFGGIVAAAVLIGFGIAAIVMGVNGGNTVKSNLKQQQIIGTPDMTPAGIKAEAAKAGLKNISFPTCSVANKAVTSGSSARCFAEYMQIHALEATGGFYYSQMGIYTAKADTPKSQLEPGGGTDNTQYAAVDPKTHQPVQNGARNVWVTETALTTALNASYMAARLSL